MNIKNKIKVSYFESKWDDQSNLQDSIYSFKNKLAENLLNSKYFQKRDSNCLIDLGCGDGRYSLKFLEFFNEGYFIDESKNALNRIKNRYNFLFNNDKKIFLINEKIEDFINTDKKRNYNFVICTNTLHYLNSNDLIKFLEYLSSFPKGTIFYLAFEFNIKMTLESGVKWKFDKQYFQNEKEVKEYINSHFSVIQTTKSKIEDHFLLNSSFISYLKSEYNDTSTSYTRRFDLFETLLTL